MNPLFSPVSNRGTPSQAVIDTLIAWGKVAAPEIFAPNKNPDDIYARIAPQLGPWTGDLHRRAAMLESLRVLEGFESSWNWEEGRDQSAGDEAPEEMEAGAFQESWNSRVFGSDLRDLLARHAITTAGGFQRAMKADHDLALEYTARLLRHTVRANGPVLRNEINRYLSRPAVAAFEAALVTV